jgi:hypothetical protein
MAETLEAITTRLQSENPRSQRYDNINGQDVPMSQERYDTWISDQAKGIREQQLADEATAAWQLTVDQFIAGRATMQADLTLVNNRINGNTSLTAAEIRIGFRDLLQSMLWVADRIADGTIVIRKP